MPGWMIVLLLVAVIPFQGCLPRRVTRDGVLSKELPITVDDIAEIRNGEENHQKVIWQHKIYQSQKLETFVNGVAANIASVSTRPTLPYRVFILDEDIVNIFGGPGGYIYITRGLLEFAHSEAELAGVLAHEIGHISHFDYSPIPQHDKVKKIYKGLLKGSELAKDSIGTYGTATYYSLRGIGQAAPYIQRQFGKDLEVEADENAVQYLLKAGYDPRAYQIFVERLSRIPVSEVSRFVVLMNTHPPFPERRVILDEKIKEVNFDSGDIEFRSDSLDEVLKSTAASSDTIRFEPDLGTRHVDPVEMNEMRQSKQEKLASTRKHVEWL